MDGFGMGEDETMDGLHELAPSAKQVTAVDACTGRGGPANNGARENNGRHYMLTTIFIAEE